MRLLSRRVALVLVLPALAVIAVACQLPGAKPRATPTPAASPTVTRTPTLQATPAASATPTWTPTITPSNTPTPTRAPQRITSANADRLQVESQRTYVTANVQSAGFSADTQSFVYGFGDGTVQLWQIGAQAPVLSLRLPGADTAKTPIVVTSVALAADGKSMAAGSIDRRARLWRFGELDKPLENGHGGTVWVVAYTKDSRIFASAGDDKNVQLRSVADNRHLGGMSGHTAPVRSLAFAPDGVLLASGSDDRTVILWRAAERKLLRRLLGHPEPVTAVAFSANGRLLASGADTVRLWRVDEPGLPQVLEKPQNLRGPIKGLAFSPDGDLLAAFGANNYIALWDVNDGRALTGLNCQQCGAAPFLTVAFSADGMLLATVSTNNQMLWWRVD